MTHSLPDLAGLRVSAEDLLAVVLETTAQPICVVDPDDRIRFASAAAIAALGYESADELIGRRGHETFVRRDGATFPGSYVSAAIEMPEGRGAVVAFADGREHDAVPAARERSLRRIATLVAGGAASAEVFGTIAREVCRVVDLPLVALWHYERDGTATVIGECGESPHPFQAGSRWPLDGPTICARVLDTGRPARIEDFADLPGTIADAARDIGIRACAGAPIIVDGAVWGVMSADSTDAAPLPDNVEDRLAEFTQLVAATISTTASRAELARLAQDQAALRRVATLVARSVAPAEVFAAVAEEVGRLLAADVTTMCRYEADGTATVVAESGDAAFPVGTRLQVDAANVGGMVLRTGRLARVDDYEHVAGSFGSRVRAVGTRSVVGCPIVVDGRLWGVMIAASRQADPLPAAIEPRIEEFTELIATAISNTEARMQARRLADEQAALRRVATLVARGVRPSELFDAVTQEAGALIGADLAAMARHETDETLTVLATWPAADKHSEVKARLPIEEGDLATRVLRTGRPARRDACDPATANHAIMRERLGIRSSVACPIVVDGRTWGGLVVHSKQTEPLPADTESRLANFADLVATAIANAEARAALGASRARIVAAADESRRRIERDLHDGTQQRLVSLMLELRSAEASEEGELRAQVARTEQSLGEALEELRELSRGIHPAILSRGGLERALQALARRSAVPVELDLRTERLPEPVEVAAYYVVSEALTNAARHAHASVVKVGLHELGSIVRVAIRDDGVGGADPARGSGLVGLGDRVEALGGKLAVTSRPRLGTTVLVEIPVAPEP